MVGALAIGSISGLLLAALPIVPATENGVTGAVLCGYALGWASLAVLSTVRTDMPQRWAWIPAFFMGLGGLLLILVGDVVRGPLDRVWPPALLALTIWMTVRVRRQHRGRGLWLLHPVMAVLVLVSLGGGYQTIGEAVDARTYPMPGQLIDVGGHRLHLSCSGTGSPTVVLEPGGGAMSSTMGWIVPTVARETRVCVYDRAGRGWSEPAEAPQDGVQIATDLHTLLQRGGVPGPYVLAGHSFGGLYVLTFADRYPDDVAGMVLVDSTAPASTAGQPTTTRSGTGSSDLASRASALLSIPVRLGLGRLYGQYAFDSLPPRSAGEARAKLATASGLRSTIDEYVQASRSAKQAAALVDVGDKPLVVLTAGVGSDARKQAVHDHLASASTNSVHRVVAGADHEALVADQEYAAVTAQAVLEVVSSVRTASPLGN